MKNLHTLLRLFLLALVLVGCKKDNDTEPDNLPIGKNWKITMVELVNGSGTINPIATAPSCDTDDIYRFRDDTTYVHEEGATKCNDSSPQIVEQGTWAKTGNTFTWDGQDYTIEELSRSTFKIKASAFGSTLLIVFTAQ